MKNIIIAGPSRAGKTTLAKMINRDLNYFVISVDKLAATFHGAYPQLDIRLNWDRKKTTNHLAPFLGHFLGMFSSSQGTAFECNLRAHAIEGNRFVLEGGYFNFDVISFILKKYGIVSLKEHFILIGLVQNQKTADDYVSDFKKYDTPDDWTYGFREDELRAYAKQDAIPFSQAMTDTLLKQGFTIYDTSTNRQQVLEQIMHDIKSKIN